MNSYQTTQKIYADILNIITKDAAEWQRFLSFAAGIYKYDFAAAVLIYAQRPDATMIADMNTWNSIGRRIKRGSKSIRVFDTESLSLRYLFDVSDTYGDRIPGIWKLNSSLENQLLERLRAKLSLTTNDFAATVNTLINQELNLDNIIDIGAMEDIYFEEVVQNSVSHLVLSRCGKTNRKHDFVGLPYCDIVELGSKVWPAAQNVLRQIESEIKHIYKEKRSVTYESSYENQLHRSRGRDAVSRYPGSQRHENRKVWQNGSEVSAGKPSNEIYGADSAGRTDSSAAESGRAVQREVNRANGIVHEVKSDSRADGHNGKRTASKQDSKTGRGDHIERASVHTKVEQADNEPSQDGSFFVAEENSAAQLTFMQTT